MSTMYEKFLTWRRYSMQELQDSQGYDSILDKACFDAQQALEFLIKAILLNYNIHFSNSHNIVYLASLLETTGLKFDKSDDLQLLADTITSWEEKGRYYDGIKTKKETVQRVYNIMKSIEEAFLAEQKEINGV